MCWGAPDREELPTRSGCLADAGLHQVREHGSAWCCGGARPVLGPYGRPARGSVLGAPASGVSRGSAVHGPRRAACRSLGVFCTMTAALVCRRSQVPGTAPVPYRRHRQRTAALGVSPRGAFTTLVFRRALRKAPRGWAARAPGPPPHLIHSLHFAREGRGFQTPPGFASLEDARGPFPACRQLQWGRARRLTVSEPSRAGASADPALLGLLRCYCN